MEIKNKKTKTAGKTANKMDKGVKKISVSLSREEIDQVKAGMLSQINYWKGLAKKENKRQAVISNKIADEYETMWSKFFKIGKKIPREEFQ